MTGGIGCSGDCPDREYFAQIAGRPSEVERRIAHEPVEWAYVFDRFGRQVFRARGGEGFVAIALESFRLQDAVLVHNHPPHLEYPSQDPRFEGGSFSDQDLDLTIAADLAQMIVVTPGWRYVMT